MQPRKCPPGVFCIENMTLVLVGSILLTLVFLFWYYHRPGSMLVSGGPMPMLVSGGHMPTLVSGGHMPTLVSGGPMLGGPMLGGSMLGGPMLGGPMPTLVPVPGTDVFLDPYAPPLQVAPMSRQMGPMLMPVNVPTQFSGQDSSYKQVGLLTLARGHSSKGHNSTGHNSKGHSSSGQATADNTILPLMGRLLLANKDKWNFYTLNDKNHMLKLPLTFKGKSGTSEYGCDNLYTGDTVYVEGYKQSFIVTMYETQTLRYIPGL